MVAQESNGRTEPISRRAGSCVCADRFGAQRWTSLSKIARRSHATVLLARSRYHVYYAPLDDALVVLAVWHASGGSGPPLRLK
jgi:hypothetical protein